MEMIRELDELRELAKRGTHNPDEWKRINEIVEAAMDIIYDSDQLEKTYAALFKKYEVEEPAVHYKDGSWHCPACEKRVHPMAHFCNWCGKRLRKGGGRFEQDW